jgi:hypothetical protein
MLVGENENRAALRARHTPHQEEALMSWNRFTGCSAGDRPARRWAAKVVVVCSILLLVTAPAFANDIMYSRHGTTTTLTDLTHVTGGGTAAPFSAIAAFYTTPNNQFHVYYVDANSSHVRQLYYNGSSWSDEDLTTLTGGPNANKFGITGFSIGNLQYVFYVDTNLHVHELNYNNVNWGDHDLTSLVGGNSASPAPLVAFATKPNNQLHVYYQDENSFDEYQLYFNGSSWSYQDLTSINGGAYCYNQWIAGFAVGNLQNLFCPGFGTFSSNLHLIHIYYNNSIWGYEDVTYNAGGFETPLNPSGVGGFVVPNANHLEVYSITDDGHFNRDYHVGNAAHWVHYDLTNSIGAHRDTQYGGVAAFVTPFNKNYHIYYAPGGVLHHLSYDGTSWSLGTLSNNANADSGIAGFGIGTTQYVFFIKGP